VPLLGRRRGEIGNQSVITIVFRAAIGQLTEHDHTA
jgi:hypothetical protein